MAKAGSAFSVRPDIVNDCILHVRTDAGRHLVQSEEMSHAPRHVMIRTRAVATHAKPPGRAIAVVQRKAAAEHNGAAEHLADEGILRGAEFGRLAGIQRGGVW